MAKNSKAKNTSTQPKENDVSVEKETPTSAEQVTQEGNQTENMAPNTQSNGAVDVDASASKSVSADVNVKESATAEVINAAPMNVVSSGVSSEVAKEKETPAEEVVLATVSGVSSVPEVTDPILAELGVARAPQILANVPRAHYAILATLSMYAQQMDPTHPILEADGARMQSRLLRMLTNLINLEESHFEPIFRVVLAWFELNSNKCMHPASAHRFLHLMPVSADELRAFNNLVDMFRLLAPAKSREVAKRQVSFEKALQYGLTDSGRQRIRNFFNV